jgi:CarboxypepD_reg-like domain
MAKNKKVLPLTAEDIEKYLAGTAVNNHEVERKLLEDGYASEAFEGFEALKSYKVNEKAAMIDLKNRLDERIKKKQENRLLGWRNISIAASVIAVLGASIFYFSSIKTKEIEVLAKNAEPQLKDTIKFEKPFEIDLEQKKNHFSIAKAKQPVLSETISYDTEDIDFEPSSPVAVLSETNESNVYDKISEKEEIKVASAPIAPIPSASQDKAILAKKPLNVLTGKVVDADNQPVPGAIIAVKGSETVTQTDIDGNFSLPESTKGETIEVKSIGYQTQSVVVSGPVTYMIKLSEDVDALSEIVVTGNTKAKDRLQTLQLEEPKPKMGWSNFDDMLLANIRKTGGVTTLNFENPVMVTVVVEPSGKVSKVQIKAEDMSKEEAEKLAKTIEKDTKWFPARRKGKKIRKEVSREVKVN